MKTIGGENFDVPPQKICLDDAKVKSGRRLESVIDVWLRILDDDA